MRFLSAMDHVVLRFNSSDSGTRFHCLMHGCNEVGKLDERGLVQLRASDSLIDLVALHSELGSSLGIAPGHERRNMNNFCLSVSAVPEQKLCATLASWSIQYSAMATRYCAQGFR